jgi:hypothetical protein
MNRFILAIVLLTINQTVLFGQNEKNNKDADPNLLCVTLIAIDDLTFPTIGTLSPTLDQVQSFGLKSSTWIKNHPVYSTFLNGNFSNSKSISTRVSGSYGQEKDIEFKTYLNTLYSAFMMQIGTPNVNEIKSLKFYFLISLSDYNLIMTRLNER